MKANCEVSVSQRRTSQLHHPRGQLQNSLLSQMLWMHPGLRSRYSAPQARNASGQRTRRRRGRATPSTDPGPLGRRDSGLAPRVRRGEGQSGDPTSPSTTRPRRPPPPRPGSAPRQDRIASASIYAAAHKPHFLNRQLSSHNEDGGDADRDVSGATLDKLPIKFTLGLRLFLTLFRYNLRT